MVEARSLRVKHRGEEIGLLDMLLIAATTTLDPRNRKLAVAGALLAHLDPNDPTDAGLRAHLERYVEGDAT